MEAVGRDGAGKAKGKERVSKRHPAKPTRKRPAGSIADSAAKRSARKRPAACVADDRPARARGVEQPQTSAHSRIYMRT